MRLPLLCALLCAAPLHAQNAAPRQVSGIYPHLAMFNDEGECGTGAVVPFADRLWVITYAPHKPTGSSDKLYEIAPGTLAQTVRPESVGGTPANRMLHTESNQLFIGPYVIGADRNVRVITPQQMFGRLTGNARHLTDSAGKILYATMEEGLYEVDVKTLAVQELWADEQRKQGRHADLPGYHGKGLYSGQGRIIYANNGDHAKEALRDPTVPSGVLASWDGLAPQWTVVRRNQFTEVTGPGGLRGNAHPETDPVWSIGWDHRSLILMLLEGGAWHAFRLPKASHSYDGAHGWNTEWPRIREIGKGDELLMTMHGTFWKFPRTFSMKATAGIAPRSTYLKVVGDFSAWNGRVVLGCDDSAKSEFLNKRKVKGELKGPGQSQSNLWFLDEPELDHLGPVLGSGSVWLREPVTAGAVSDPFLFAGYAQRGLWLATGTEQPVKIALETEDGTGKWSPLREVEVKGTEFVEFPGEAAGVWIRLRSSAALPQASAVFHYSQRVGGAPDHAETEGLTGLDVPAAPRSRGTLLALGENRRTLAMAARTEQPGQPAAEALYELDAALNLKRVDDAGALTKLQEATPIPQNAVTVEKGSILIVDDAKRRWRLPKGDEAWAQAPDLRICREVCTERDLLQVHGTFYELPAENAGGFAKMRPVTTHGKSISDYATFRGLLVMAGVDLSAAVGGHIVKSDDGKAALWVGAVDDLWRFGAPRGRGGPWTAEKVAVGAVSDPYLFRGYASREVKLTAHGAAAANLTLELDVTGEGDWIPCRTFAVPAGQTVEYTFPSAMSAYWVRARSASAAEVSVEFTYR